MGLFFNRREPAPRDTTPTPAAAEHLDASEMPPAVDMLELLDRLIEQAGLVRKEVDRFSMLMTLNKLLEQEASARLAEAGLDVGEFRALAGSRQWNAGSLWAHLSSLGPRGATVARSLSAHLGGAEFTGQIVDLLQQYFGPGAGVPDPDAAVLPLVLVERLEQLGWDLVNPALLKGVFRGKYEGRTQLVFLYTDGPNRFFLASPVVETDLTDVPQWMREIEVSYAWDMLADMIVLVERLGAPNVEGPSVERIFARAEDIAFRADELESATGPEDRL